MSDQGPIIDYSGSGIYDPDKAPRTTAIILVICGLLAIGFFVVNFAFTGEDPYQTDVWYGDDDRPIQERGSVLPNVWRGATAEDETPNLPPAKSKPVKKPATNPFSLPGSYLTPTTRPVGSLGK